MLLLEKLNEALSDDSPLSVNGAFGVVNIGWRGEYVGTVEFTNGRYEITTLRHPKTRRFTNVENLIAKIVELETIDEAEMHRLQLCAEVRDAVRRTKEGFNYAISDYEHTALALINQAREAFGERCIAKFPKGEPGQVRSCPIAMSLPGCEVADFELTAPDAEAAAKLAQLWGTSADGNSVVMPDDLTRFVRSFDAGALKHLSKAA